MPNIAIIGAGSLSFTHRLMLDFLAVPELQASEFRFMDIDDESLQMATQLCEKLITDHRLPARIHATHNRREAVRDADYVLAVIRVGGLAAFRHDIEIPMKYGVDQCVGDTLGPGGVFYFLRTIPVLLDLAADMRELAPGALFLNYANPMAMNCWALRRAGGVRLVGLCHGVQNSQTLIARGLGIPEAELTFTAAGINHQTWFVQIDHNGTDMRPRLLEAFENHPEISRAEPCRIDVLRRFGYWSTESNGHLSEYLPWYRKHPEKKHRYIADDWFGGESAGYLREYQEHAEEYRQLFPRLLRGEIETQPFSERTSEHASYIIEALETGKLYRGHFNIENRNLITNLPNGSTIEIPCYVDRSGIHPTYFGDLPLACAATCRASIGVQEMAVQAALTGNRELVKQAVLHDPLTAAVCTPDEVWAMCDELFDALAPWLPQFNGEGRRWPDLPSPGL